MMKRAVQVLKAERFREMHHHPQILVLPNAWDATSARIFEQSGFEAIGTTSAGISALFGYPDGERIRRSEMIAMIKRIAQVVDVPVNADIEAGYGSTIASVVETTRMVIAAGAVGVNIEDSTRLPDHPLMELGYQTELIRAIRQTAADEGVPLVINARVDIYLREVDALSGRFARAVERSKAYLEAGADCIFIIGLTDSARIHRLVEAIQAPVNVLMVPGSPSIGELQSLGVRRVSFGSGLMRAALPHIFEISKTIQADKDLTPYLQHEFTHAVVNRWFE